MIYHYNNRLSRRNINTLNPNGMPLDEHRSAFNDTKFKFTSVEGISLDLIPQFTLLLLVALAQSVVVWSEEAEFRLKYVI